MRDLTEAELRALAYYAIGVASEGRDVAYELSFCGYIKKGLRGEAQLKPIGNSGYTVGEMQTDFGARPDEAKELVKSFQAWAQAQQPDWVMPAADETQAATALGRDGHLIRDPDYRIHNETYRRAHAGQDIPNSQLPSTGSDIDPVFKERLNTYLATDAGKSFVHSRDVIQVEELKRSVAEPLQKSPLYRQSSAEDQAKLFGMMAKAYNQGPTLANRILHDIRQGQLNSVDDVYKRIEALPDYMRTGRNDALDGVTLFNALRSASEKNSMRAAWQAVIANPLIDPTQVRNDPHQPHLGKQYDTVKGLFVQSTEGAALVKALEQGVVRSHGDPSKRGSRGFHVAGQDFVHWDRSGQGRAFVGGQWSEFSRSELSRVEHKDKSYDLQISRGGQTLPLFHGGKSTPHIADPRGAKAEQAPQVLLDNPSHPGHTMYQQAHEGMRRIDASMGRTSDRFTDNAAACLAVAACRSGLTRIDDAAWGEDRRSVWVIQGQPGSFDKKFANAPVESFSIPVEQTSGQWALAQQQAVESRRMAQQRLDELQQITQQHVNPSQSGPAMRM